MDVAAIQKEKEAFAKKPESIGRVSASKPMNGKEFLESLRDGREIYIYGDRVKDVTTHPAFRNTARMVARLYDALHDPKQKDVLTCPTDTGSGTFTHRYFRVAKSRDDLFLFGLRSQRRRLRRSFILPKQ
jgi:4-hydroxyphenylacetate 3-monooxygenase